MKWFGLQYKKSYVKNCPTKRAPDAGDSAHIPSIFLRLSFFLAGRLRRPHPSAGNANRWGAGQRANAKPSLICKCRFIIEFRKPNSVFSGGVFSSLSLSLYFASKFSSSIFFIQQHFVLLAKFLFGFIESQKSASRFFGFGFGQRWF
jgi:hypothetical protein